VWLHVLTFGKKESITLPALPFKCVSAKFMNGEPVKMAVVPEGWMFQVGAAHQKRPVTVIELTLDGSADGLDPISLMPAEKSQ
jgi:hypothetical protein